MRRESYVDAILDIGIQLAEALEYSHRMGILHCDVKPSNVLLLPSGQAMLFDFNLSFCGDATQLVVGGTLPYMPPERLKMVQSIGLVDKSGVDARSDIYSLGVTLYEALTGELPYGEIPPDMEIPDAVREILTRQEKGTTRLHKMQRSMCPGLAQIVERCLRIDPSERPPSAQHIVDALRAELSAMARVRRWISQRRLIMASSLVGVVSIGLGVFALAQSSLIIGLNRDEMILSAEQAYNNNQFDQAVTRLLPVVRRNPADDEAWFLSGRSYMQLGDFKQAEHDFYKVAELGTPLRGPSLACIAHCLASDVYQYHQVGSNWASEVESVDEEAELVYRKAIELYMKAIDEGTSSSALYNNLGYCRLLIGELTNAADAYRRAFNFEWIPEATAINALILDREFALANNEIPDQTLIKRVRHEYPRSPAVYLELACTHALNIKLKNEGVVSSSVDFDRFVQASAHSAVRYGLDPQKLMIVGSYYPPVMDDPSFVKLLHPPNPQSRNIDVEWMIDPLTQIQALSQSQ